jgi:uncharacterized membrane protein YidH (DUF202 family)
MTPALRASARHWLAGLALASAGVAANRLLAPCFSSPQVRAACAVTGELVALTGLLVIMLGVRRRIRMAEQANQSAPRV